MPVPQPYEVIKHVPVHVKEYVKVPVHVPQPYPVEKKVPYPVHVPGKYFTLLLDNRFA